MYDSELINYGEYDPKLSKADSLPHDLKVEIVSYINACDLCGRSGACQLDGTLSGIHASSNGNVCVLTALCAHEECISFFCCNCRFCCLPLDIYHSCREISLMNGHEWITSAKYAGSCNIHGTMWAMT